MPNRCKRLVASGGKVIKSNFWWWWLDFCGCARFKKLPNHTIIFAGHSYCARLGCGDISHRFCPAHWRIQCLISCMTTMSSTVLTAYDRKNKANSAFKLPKNSTWFCPSLENVVIKPIIDFRQTTSPKMKNLSKKNSALWTVLLWFSMSCSRTRISKTNYNWAQIRFCFIFFWDIEKKKINAKQCNIIVNDNLCIWLHDYHSTHKFAVGHNDHNQNEMRKSETKTKHEFWHSSLTRKISSKKSLFIREVLPSKSNLSITQ